MSFTIVVPAAVPSLFHSSVQAVASKPPKNTVLPTAPRPKAGGPIANVPAAVPSLRCRSEGTVKPGNGRSAVKKRSPPAAVSCPGGALPGPAARSAPSMVPGQVPSLFQSSRPLLASTRVKKSVEPTAVKSRGSAAAPSTATCTDPGPVPSLFHSAQPVPGSEATKKGVLATSVRYRGVEPVGPATMSLTRVGVLGPSARQSSSPVPGAEAEKNRVVPIAPRYCGNELALPGVRSATSAVPGRDPSLLQSSTPVAGSVAVKNTRPPAMVSCGGPGPLCAVSMSRTSVGCP